MILFYGSVSGQAQRLVSRLAQDWDTDEVKCLNQRFSPHASMALWRMLDRCEFCLIWNGWQWFQPLVANFCRQHGVPHGFVENGMLPQKAHFRVDPTGFCGDSFLNGDLEWVTGADMDALWAKRQELQEEFPRRDDGHILLCLQIPSDTQVAAHSGFFEFDGVVERAMEMFPDERILLRPHPKFRGNVEAVRYGRRVRMDDPDSNIMGTIAGAKRVVAVSSTCLYEAAAYGVPVTALGSHPLNGASDPDRVVAGAMAMNFPRSGEGMAARLERVGCRPRTNDARWNPHPVPEEGAQPAGRGGGQAAGEDGAVPERAAG